jgi:hypothetical protein
MKIALLLLLLSVQVFAKDKKQVRETDFVVGSIGHDEGYSGLGGTAVKTKWCYLTVSDGNIAYQLTMEKQGLFTRACPDFDPGTKLHGMTDGKHVVLLAPQDNGKVKKLYYEVSSKSATPK